MNDIKGIRQTNMETNLIQKATRNRQEGQDTRFSPFEGCEEVHYLRVPL